MKSDVIKMKKQAIIPDIAGQIPSVQTTTFIKGGYPTGDKIYSSQSIKNFEQNRTTQKTLSGYPICDESVRVLRELHAGIMSGEISSAPINLSRFFCQDDLGSWGRSLLQEVGFVKGLTFAPDLILPPEELDKIASDYQHLNDEIIKAKSQDQMIRHLVARRDIIEILYGAAPGGVTDAGQ